MSQSLRRIMLAFALVGVSLHAGGADASGTAARTAADQTAPDQAETGQTATGQTATDKIAAAPVAGIHAAVSRQQSADVVATLIEHAIRQSGHTCKLLRDYQMFGTNRQGLTLKAKCAEQPTYVLHISPRDEVRVSGGDGTIQPMNPQDGPITAVWGVRAEKYLSQNASSAAAAKAPAATAATESRRATTAAGALPSLEEGSGWWNPVLLAGLLLAFLLALPLLIWLNTRPSEAQGFTSHDKDLLLAESREILPSIYQHPDGWFIVRGRRVKRRVFRMLLFAYLYRTYGVKLGEVR